MTVYLNGEFVSLEEARIGVEDRGFLYGDALYESIRLYSGGFFRFREHWQRLAQGAVALKIEAPAHEQLREIVGQVPLDLDLRAG